MAIVIQYEFNNKNQWESAGVPKLEGITTEIIELGRKITGYAGLDENGFEIPIYGNKYYVEVLFIDLDEIPDNGLLSAKAVEPILHQFIGYPSLKAYENKDNYNPTQPYL